MNNQVSTFEEWNALSPKARDLSLSLKEHNICFVVPAGAKIDAHRMDLPGGILILGALRANVFCASGSAIVAAGGEFQGDLDAVDIYIEGKITSPKSSSRPVSRLKARGEQEPSNNDIRGGLAAFGVNAQVHAHILARAFHVPRQATFLNAIFEVIRP